MNSGDNIFRAEKLGEDFQVEGDFSSFFAPDSTLPIALKDLRPQYVKDLEDVSKKGNYNRVSIEQDWLEYGPTLPSFFTELSLGFPADDESPENPRSAQLITEDTNSVTYPIFCSLLENFTFFPGDRAFRSTLRSLVHQMWNDAGREHSSVKINFPPRNKQWGPVRDNEYVYFVANVSLKTKAPKLHVKRHYLFAVERRLIFSADDKSPQKLTSLEQSSVFLEQSSERRFSYVSLEMENDPEIYVRQVISSYRDKVLVESIANVSRYLQLFSFRDGGEIVPLDVFEFKNLPGFRLPVYSFPLSGERILSIGEKWPYHFDVLDLTGPKEDKKPQTLFSGESVIGKIQVDDYDWVWITGMMRPDEEDYDLNFYVLILGPDLKTKGIFSLDEHFPEMKDREIIGHITLKTLRPDSPYNFILFFYLDTPTGIQTHYYGLALDHSS